MRKLMQLNSKIPTGSLNQLLIESKELKSNLLGDPTTRKTQIYLPYGFKNGKDLPLLVALAPFTSSGLALTSWKMFSENLPERLDRLIYSGKTTTGCGRVS